MCRRSDYECDGRKGRDVGKYDMASVTTSIQFSIVSGF